jgi:hypothetical protein
MWLYLVRRLGLAAAIVAVAVTMLFTMIHMVPGDPASIMLGPRATPELREALRVRLGLDDPFIVQVGSFFMSVLRGDLGYEPVYSGVPITRDNWPEHPDGRRRVVREWQECSRRITDGTFAPLDRTTEGFVPRRPAHPQQ